MRAAIVLTLLSTIASPTPASVEEITVKIEATLPDAVKLIERLNENGSKEGFKFRLVESDYQFRIAVASEGPTATDMIFNNWGGADASAAVLTADCRLLFIVSRSGRMSQSGALNAVAKELVKKFALYRKATGQVGSR